jgi:hypothetical protein
MTSTSDLEFVWKERALREERVAEPEVPEKEARRPEPAVIFRTALAFILNSEVEEGFLRSGTACLR